MKFAFLTLLLGFMVSGCSTTDSHVQWYQGPQKSADKVAILHIQRDFAEVHLTVDSIDGALLNKGKSYVLNTTKEVELLPGHHDFMVAYSDSNNERSISDAKIGLDAYPGKVYSMYGARADVGFAMALRLALIGGRSTWILWIVDDSTGKVVAGQSRNPRYHWYEY